MTTLNASALNDYINDFYENDSNVEALSSYLTAGLNGLTYHNDVIPFAVDYAFDLLSDYTAVERYLSELDYYPVLEMLDNGDYYGVVKAMVFFWTTGYMYEKSNELEDNLDGKY